MVGKRIVIISLVSLVMATAWLVSRAALENRRQQPLVGLRKPFSRILVYPGVRFLDTQDKLTTALTNAGVAFEYTLPFEGRQAGWMTPGDDPGIRFDVTGRVLPGTDPLPLHFQALIRNGNIRAVHITCANLSAERANEVYAQWRRGLRGEFGHPAGIENRTAGVTEIWFDQYRALQILIGLHTQDARAFLILDLFY